MVELKTAVNRKKKDVCGADFQKDFTFFGMTKIAQILSNSFILLVFIVGLSACEKNAMISETSSIEGGLWNASDVKEFAFDVEDTLAGHNFYVLVRNNEKYPYRNLYLFINLEFGDKIVKDTVYCELASPDGKWLGTGIGDHHNSEILYKRNQVFPELGPYKISIEQAMREEDIIGITDIGISIIKNN